MPNKYERVTVVEAGRKGGQTVLAQRGREFFVEIGDKGQRALRDKYPGMARQWGKMGGRPKKPKLSEAGEEVNLERGGVEPVPILPPPKYYSAVGQDKSLYKSDDLER